MQDASRFPVPTDDFAGTTNPDRALSGSINIFQLFLRIDDLAASRKVGTLHDFFADQLVRLNLWIFKQLEQRLAKLFEIVRRDVGRHTDSNAGCAIQQQVGNAAGQDDRFFAAAVVVGTKGDGSCRKIRQDFASDPRAAAFGVSHGGSIVAVDAAEVATAVDKRHAKCEPLRHSHESIVDRTVTVWVVVRHRIAHDLRRFTMLGVVIEAQLSRRIQNPPLNRFEPVTNIGQRASRNDGQRIVEVACLSRDAQWDSDGVVEYVDEFQVGFSPGSRLFALTTGPLFGGALACRFLAR